MIGNDPTKFPMATPIQHGIGDINQLNKSKQSDKHEKQKQ